MQKKGKVKDFSSTIDLCTFFLKKETGDMCNTFM